jgi:hypothetical protein
MWDPVSDVGPRSLRCFEPVPRRSRFGGRRRFRRPCRDIRRRGRRDGSGARWSVPARTDPSRLLLLRSSRVPEPGTRKRIPAGRPSPPTSAANCATPNDVDGPAFELRQPARRRFHREWPGPATAPRRSAARPAGRGSAHSAAARRGPRGSGARARQGISRGSAADRQPRSAADRPRIGRWHLLPDVAYNDLRRPMDDPGRPRQARCCRPWLTKSPKRLAEAPARALGHA